MVPTVSGGRRERDILGGRGVFIFEILYIAFPSVFGSVSLSVLVFDHGLVCDAGRAFSQELSV